MDLQFQLLNGDWLRCGSMKFRSDCRVIVPRYGDGTPDIFKDVRGDAAMGRKGEKFMMKSLRIAPVNGKILKEIGVIISLEPQSPVGCVCIMDGNWVRQGLTRGKG